MGSAGHEALDRYKQTDDVNVAVLAVQEQYEDCPEGFDLYEWQMESTTVQCLISGYAWRWGDASLTMVASEQSFELPLVNPETGKATPLFNLAGKIDGIIQEDDRKLVLEHKFIGEDIGPESDYWRRLVLDGQITLYTYAARQLGHDVSGVMYDLIRKPTIRPGKIPILDDDGLKQVIDEYGNRIRNKSIKPKKTCEKCKGEGVFPDVQENRELDPCPCTLGKWRQTADKERNYFLVSRDMMPEEWQTKLLADITERPDWYYQRQEIARLDDDIEEMCAEVWEIQQTIRTAQKTGRWYKTVNHNTCTFCPYFHLCCSKYDPDVDAIPEGFECVANVHPELNENPTAT
jgi:hypothetical protein